MLRGAAGKVKGALWWAMEQDESSTAGLHCKAHLQSLRTFYIRLLKYSLSYLKYISKCFLFSVFPGRDGLSAGWTGVVGIGRSPLPILPPTVTQRLPCA